jgi:hypothetical protein
MAEQRKTYTAEFKVAAVKLVTEQGYSVVELATGSETPLPTVRGGQQKKKKQAALRARGTIGRECPLAP